MGIFQNYPIIIGGHILPSPTQWSIQLGNIESVMTTEAGTDVVDTTRPGKVQISASFRLAEGADSEASIGQEVKALEEFACITHPIAVSFYDPREAGYATKGMRMRNFQASLVSKSDKLTEVNGVWNVSFTLIEY